MDDPTFLTEKDFLAENEELEEVNEKLAYRLDETERELAQVRISLLQTTSQRDGWRVFCAVMSLFWLLGLVIWATVVC